MEILINPFLSKIYGGHGPAGFEGLIKLIFQNSSLSHKIKVWGTIYRLVFNSPENGKKRRVFILRLNTAEKCVILFSSRTQK